MPTRPQILGIVNITSDSFSDGGKFLAPADAIAQAERLIADGADIVDLGPAASNPDAAVVTAEEEITRLKLVVGALQKKGVRISIDSFQLKTQRYAISQQVEFLNDIQGFGDPEIYPELARTGCKLIVMHSVQRRGRATRVDVSTTEAWEGIVSFFEQRIKSLTAAGIGRDRIIIDPGMGFFLSSRPEVSFEVLARIGELKKQFGLPVHVSVSRKSFLRAQTSRDKSQIGAATVAAEVLAAIRGADYIRTHDAGALVDALKIVEAVG